MHYLLSHDANALSKAARPGKMQSSSLFRNTSYEDEAKSFETCIFPFEDLTVEELPFAAGGAGQVYKGVLCFAGKEIAVAAKRTFGLILAGTGEAMNTKEVREEFDNELRMLARLRHPNINRMFGMCFDPLSDAVYICLEFCSGGTLNDLIAHDNAAFTPAVYGKAAGEILAGVGYMHRAGVVHRDLKPQNIFIADDGRVCIGDLGASSSSKIFGAREMGTIHYLPPEAMQLRAGATSTDDPASRDVFALGTILVEMWARVHPWSFATNEEVKELVLAGMRPDFPTTDTTRLEDGVEVSPCPPPPPVLQDMVYESWAALPAARPDVGNLATRFAPVAALLSVGRIHDDWWSVDWLQDDDCGRESVLLPSFQSLKDPVVADETEYEEERPACEDDEDTAGSSSVADEQSFWIPTSDVLLDAGWHPQSGTVAERAAAIDSLWGRSMPDLDSMRRWYSDQVSSHGSPWALAAQPRQWRLTSVAQMEDGQGSSARHVKAPGRFATSVALRASTTTLTFAQDSYVEKVR